MNIEKWIIAHFSPTGGTKKVADAIAAGLGTPVEEMDLTRADAAASLGENDALMAVLPVYAGRVPQISLQRLSALKANGQKAVAVVVYGNREYDDALLETKEALEANGFQVIAAAAFIAEHSIVRSIAANRPDAEDEKIARQFAADVMAKADDTDRYDIRFDIADYYGGLHCGECMEVFTGGKWKPTRIEYGENWYLVGIRAEDLNGLRVRI